MKRHAAWATPDGHTGMHSSTDLHAMPSTRWRHVSLAGRFHLIIPHVVPVYPKGLNWSRARPRIAFPLEQHGHAHSDDVVENEVMLLSCHLVLVHTSSITNCMPR